MRATVRGAVGRGLLAGALMLAVASGSGWADPPRIQTGANVSLQGRRLLPPDNPWNQDISKRPVDPNSRAILERIGAETGLHADFGADWNGGPFGIPYVVVTGKQPRVPVKFEYADESDPGPYPIPPDAPIEGGAQAEGDRHVLVLDRDRWTLYETWASFPDGKGWRAGSGAIFDLNSNRTRPAGWTSADAAGLPILPGLVRYDEVVEAKAVTHAVRFTVRRSRRAYVPPASHWASSATDETLPPMGMRVRLRADFDVSGFPASARVILLGLQKYGMILADNGSDWFISGAPDARWKDEELNTLRKVRGGDFEVLRMDGLVQGR